MVFAFLAGALERESEKYIELINQKDNISELSTWQMFLVCYSIISSPVRKSDLYKFSLDWAEFKANVEKNEPRFENKSMSFRNEALTNEKWTADCVSCWSSIENSGIFSKTTVVNLFFTHSLDDKYSVYVLKEENGVTYISDYIKNVPVLMNSRLSITNDPPVERSYSQEYYH